MVNSVITKDIIGEILSKSRTISEKSQKSMAKLLNVSPGTIANWEQGIGCPDMVEYLQWFDALGINAMRPLLDYFYPSTFYGLSADDDSRQIRTALIKYFSEVASDDEIRKMSYNIFGESGSSWKAQLEMITAHNHMTMKSRVNVAQTVLDSYEMEQAREELVNVDHVMPNYEYLRECVAKGKKSVFEKRKGYV